MIWKVRVCVRVCVRARVMWGEGVERLWPGLAQCAEICAEDLRKITQNMNHIISPSG